MVAGLAQKHGFSEDAVMHMLIAVRNGSGSMAQFDHHEFSGSGQWMRGGMLMLSDMFNHRLKASVDALCSEIGEILAREPGLLQRGSFQSQHQSGGAQQQNSGALGVGSGASLFVVDAASQWWPPELGQPSATGSQNDVRYAYFGPARRLAVEINGRVQVYDTLSHQIGGVSQQQQGTGGSVTFTSQHGTVALSALPLISPASTRETASSTADHAAPAGGQHRAADDVFSAIERLGKLRDEGLLTEEEFARKKAELLQRI